MDTPIGGDDDYKKDDERERIEKHEGRANCLFKSHVDCEYILLDLWIYSDLRDNRAPQWVSASAPARGRIVRIVFVQPRRIAEDCAKRALGPDLEIAQK